jgi:hypothetical protein
VSPLVTPTEIGYLYFLKENNTHTALCAYRWVYFPHRKNDVRELSEELLVQKQEWQQWAIEEQEACTDAAVPEAAEHKATHQGSKLSHQQTQYC